MKVSVAIITFNHEKFIRKAIESALMQEVDFDYELVVGEDCSTDRTREILVTLQQEHPERIRLLLNDVNLGMQRNFVNTLQACRGDYIAILDGDDFWTSTRKIQSQVEFLAAHPDHVICFHNVWVARQTDEAPTLLCPAHQKKTSTLEDLLRGNFIPSCSAVFKRASLIDFPDWFYSLPMSDWPLFIMIARHGKIGYIDEAWATYRAHASGVFSTKSRVELLETTLDLYDALRGRLNLDRMIDASTVQTYYALADAHRDAGDLEQARTSTVNCLRTGPWHSGFSFKAKMIARVVAPRLYRCAQSFFKSMNAKPS